MIFCIVAIGVQAGLFARVFSMGVPSNAAYLVVAFTTFYTVVHESPKEHGLVVN
jgi:hypothetical protein